MDLWDVYIWPIRNTSLVRLIAKSVDHDKACEIYDRYLSTNTYDVYMVPAGTKLYI